jgi:signal transduction histidine kinase
LENTALDRVNRMKSDLMATVSHETRTPLAVMSGYAELIAKELRRKGVDAQTADDLDQISEEIQRIAVILEEMQRLSRESDNTASRDWVQLSDIINQSARLYTPILERKNTTLTVSLADALPPVFANAGELTQILFNLLQNSRNHTENGAVTIGAELTDGEIAVTVSDTGTGISPEFLPFAFERGSHGDPDGSGLGLAICKEIAEAHGGKITIESELCKGAAVTFTLPLSKEVNGDGDKNGLIG